MSSKPEIKDSHLLNNKSLPTKNTIAFLIIFIALLIFYSPIVFEGLDPGGVDTMSGIGKRNVVREYTEKTGDPYLWNPNIFCGIPEYFTKNNESFSVQIILRSIGRLLDWRIAWFMLGTIGLFLLFNYFNFPWYFALIGATAFLFFPHLQGLILVGHATKLRALMYIPIIIYTFLNFTKKRNIISISLFTLFFAAQFQTKHYQIIFYTLLILLAVGIHKIVQWVKEKKLKRLYKSLAMFIPALVVAVLMSALPLFVAQEYTPYSTRGGKAIELQENMQNSQPAQAQKSKGVTFEYATKWSYSLKEYLGTFIPRAVGGTSAEVYTGKKYPRLQGQKLPTYWGDMPFTQSSEYFGIIVIILAISGIVYYRKNGFVITLTILLAFSFLLSLGKHFPPLYKLLFYYLPYFSKFRVPMMILTLMDFLLVILAMYGLKGIISDLNQKKIKQVTIIGAIFGGIGLILFLAPGLFSMNAPGDTRYNPQVINMLKLIRKEYLSLGALRMVVLVGIFLASVWLYFKQKISLILFSGIVFLLIAFDLISVSYRYFDSAQLSNKTALESRYFRPNQFDQIMRKTEKQYRVIGLGQEFQSNRLAYRHQLVGGYSATKPQLIQDIIDNNLFINRGGKQTINWSVLNMLNTRYIIAPGQIEHPALTILATDNNQNRILYSNQDALPRVYFVENVKYLDNEREVLRFMNSDKFKPAQMALTSEKIEQKTGYDTTARATITEYTPNRVALRARCKSKAFMILADAYFPIGWQATIDKQPTHIFQVNHMLRGIEVTPGEHEIVFKFRPKSYQRARIISSVFTYLVWILLGVSLIIKYRFAIKKLMGRLKPSSRKK